VDRRGFRRISPKKMVGPNRNHMWKSEGRHMGVFLRHRRSDRSVRSATALFPPPLYLTAKEHNHLPTQQHIWNGRTTESAQEPNYQHIQRRSIKSPRQESQRCPLPPVFLSHSLHPDKLLGCHCLCFENSNHPRRKGCVQRLLP